MFPKNVLFYFVILFVGSRQISCQGVFEIKIKEITNDEGIDQIGTCCSSDNSAPEGTCSKPCRTAFRVCFTHFQHRVDPDKKCTFGTFITPVLGGNSFRPGDTDFIRNHPIQFNFTFSWPGSFSLIIDVLHVNENNTNFDASIPDYKIISRLVKSGHVLPVKSERGEWTSPAPYRHLQSELEYSYRVRCSANIYGNSCNKLCRPRNDPFGHFTCNEDGERVCLTGWTDDNTGAYCTKAICSSDCHPEHGTCTVPNQCICKLGWQGKSCDECVIQPGCIHGKCTEPYKCYCDPGWGGLYCNQDLNYCTNHKPCHNGALCTNSGYGSYTCSCKDGYFGENCQFEVDECASSPCGNGATCNDLVDGVQCICPVGFFGQFCDETHVTCADMPCQNGGICTQHERQYTCECLTQWEGVNCETTTDRCSLFPCQNGGLCENTPNGFECQCQKGFSGAKCEVAINRCSTDPCLNGATCLDKKEGGYTCRCIPGFVGKRCQTNFDDCVARPCANGGICHDLINHFKCTCQPGFAGYDCSHNINDCAGSPCENGGTCHDLVHDFKCYCAEGFTGSRCTEYVETDNEFKAHVSGAKSDPMIILVNERNDNLSTSQWIAICFGAGLLVLILVIASGCLIFHRKREALSEIRKSMKLSGSRDSEDTDLQISRSSSESVVVMEEEDALERRPTSEIILGAPLCHPAQEKRRSKSTSEQQHLSYSPVSKHHLAANGSSSNNPRCVVTVREPSVRRVAQTRRYSESSDRDSSHHNRRSYTGRMSGNSEALGRLPTYQEACEEHEGLLGVTTIDVNTRKEMKPSSQKRISRSSLKNSSINNEELTVFTTEI